MLPALTPPAATRITPDETLAAVKPAAGVIDVLSEFQPGQKLMAQIQAQLASGAYRATIAQRDVVLQLPFSAKAGDALELEVVETQGRVAFAVARKDGEPAANAARTATSTPTVISRTGQAIAALFHDADQQSSKPLPLNAGRPIAPAGPPNTQALAANLQQSVSKSGMFYESHLASWVAGRLPTERIQQEPQAILARFFLQNFSAAAASGSAHPPGQMPSSPTPSTALAAALAQALPAAAPASISVMPGASAPMPQGALLFSALFGSAGGPQAGFDLATALQTATANPASPNLAASVAAARPGTPPNPSESAVRPGQPGLLARAGESAPQSAASLGGTRGGIPAELAPLVQQQLSGLANQTYPFHTQLWPGQSLEWELIDDGQAQSGEGEEARPWRTRLRLLLPSLGGIDALLTLHGDDLTVAVTPTQTSTGETLYRHRELLRQRLELAGISLQSLDVAPAEEAKLKDSDEPR